MRFDDFNDKTKYSIYEASRNSFILRLNEDLASSTTIIDRTEYESNCSNLVDMIEEKMDSLNARAVLGQNAAKYSRPPRADVPGRLDLTTEDNKSLKYENKSTDEIEKMKLQEEINALRASTSGAASTGTNQDLQTAQRELQELQIKFNALKDDETAVKGKLAVQEAAVTGLTSEVETEKGKLISLQEKLDDCTKDLNTRLTKTAAEKLQGEKIILTEKIEELNATISAAQQTTVPADAPEDAAVTKLNAGIKELKKQLEEIRIEKVTLEGNVETLNTKVVKLEQENAAVTQQLKAEQAKLVAALQEQSNELQSQHKNELTILLKFVENHLDPNFDKSKDYESEIIGLCLKYQALQFDNLTLREHVDRIKELESKHCDTEVEEKVAAATGALETEHATTIAATQAIHEGKITGLQEIIAKHTEQGSEIARLQLQIAAFQNNSSTSSSNNPLEAMPGESEDRATAKEMWKFMLDGKSIDASMTSGEKTAFKQRFVTMFAQEQFKDITRSIGVEFVNISKRIPLVIHFKNAGIGLWIDGKLEWTKTAYKMSKGSYDKIISFQTGVTLSDWDNGKNVEKISKDFFDYMNSLFKDEAPTVVPAAVPIVVPSPGATPGAVPSPGVDPSLATSPDWDQMTLQEQEDYTDKQSEEMRKRAFDQLLTSNPTSLSPSPDPVGGDGGNPPTINTNNTAPPPEIEDACYKKNNLTDALKTYYSGQSPTSAVRKQFIINWLEVNKLSTPGIQVGNIQTVFSAGDLGDTPGRIVKDRWNRILAFQGLPEVNTRADFLSQLKNLLGYSAIDNPAQTIDPPVKRITRASVPPELQKK